MDSEFSRYSTKGSEGTKVLIFVGSLAFLLIAFIAYKNYQFHSTGEAKRHEDKMRKNKKNKTYWNAGEIG